MTEEQANDAQMTIDWVQQLSTRKVQLDGYDAGSWVVDVYATDTRQHVLRIRDAAAPSRY